MENMQRWFELWDTSSNLVGDYKTQAEALDVIRNAIFTHGVESVSQLTLVETWVEDTIIAMGDDLVELARNS